MRRILPILLIAVATAAVAGTVGLSWTNPAQNTDGSAIPASGPGSIASTRIEWGTCSGTAFGSALGEFVVQGAAESATTPDLPPGTYCLRAFSRNSYGKESGPSAVAQKTIEAPTPRPPGNFSIA